MLSMQKQLSCFAILFIIGFVRTQISNDLNVNDVEKQIQQIPGLENLNSSALPSTEDVEKIVKEKCSKNGGGDEAFDALQAQQTIFRECMEQYVNATKIQLELDEAKKSGSMDEVFGKYCKKYPEINECIQNLTETIRPCLDEKENETLTKVMSITKELKEFICYKDGDRIAMFIAEAGFECLSSQQEGLQSCANNTLGTRIPKEFTINNLPSFLFTEQDCRDFDTIRLCFIKELENCKNSTPANIVDALFKFLKKHMPCHQESENSLKNITKSLTSKSNSFSMSSISILLLSFVYSMLVFY